MDRQRLQDCLGHVAAYRASGKRAAQWAAEHGVPLRSPASWCAHAGRWQARLDGVSPPVVGKPVGSVAARLPAESASGSVRIELQAGATAVALRWPTAHTLELAAWLPGLPEGRVRAAAYAEATRPGAAVAEQRPPGNAAEADSAPVSAAA